MSRLDLVRYPVPVVAVILPVSLTGGLGIFLRNDVTMTEAEFGSVVAAFFTASAVLSVPGGLLSQRWGARMGIRVALGLSCASLLGIAFFARSYVALAGLLALAGCANGVMQPAANLAIAHNVEEERQGLAHGIKQSAMPGAALVAGFAVPLFGTTIGWRWAFGLAGMASLALVCSRTIAEMPTQQARSVDHERAPVRVLPVLVLALAAGCGSAAAISLGAFLVEGATRDGVRPALAGLVLSLASAAGLASRVVVGWFADRRQGRHFAFVAMMLVAGAVGFSMLPFGGTSSWFIALGALLGFAGGWGWPGLFNFAVLREHRSSEATVSGVLQAGGATGGIVGPAAFGLLVARHSFALAWAVAAIMTSLAAVLVLVGGAMVRGRR